MGGEIPMYTVALIAVSDFIVGYWWGILAFPIVAVTMTKYLSKTIPQFKFQLDALKFRLPILGEILFKIRLARLANYMALLYSSGITVLRALEITKTLMNNVVLESAVDRVRKNISDGSGLSDSFAMVGIFPPLVIRMVRVGENTGSLDESLLNVSYFYNREVQESIDKLEPAITPLLTIIMGSLLGWIMMSVLGPIWDTIGSIGS
jgi:type IV pilus assembly protein PilC